MDIAKLKGHGQRFHRRFLCILTANLGFMVLAAMAARYPGYHPGLLLLAGIGLGITLGLGIGFWIVYVKDGDAWLLECKIQQLRELIYEAKEVLERLP